ncbi:MAG TPA: aminodeoxychorismate/anthranilate synthase component II [Bacteroidetes bacterium]|nr:aminodeoxychorismate/anthranilate synthase component II [Bacteroidota bacterium]
MIVVLDNYDSFTYNLVQAVGLVTSRITVFRNDKVSVEEIAELKPEGIIISPGPGRPENAGISVALIQTLGSSIPILGVCLGHQAAGLAFGSVITYAPSPLHGKASQIHHDGTDLFRGLPSPFPAARYHSLVISPDGLPPDLIVTATTGENIIMGIKHREFPVYGVQFHPESILTPHGIQIIKNWMEKRV